MVATQVESAIFRDAARTAIKRAGRDAFWDGQLLEGVATELRLTRLFEDAWDDDARTQPGAVSDAVDHVHTVLFNRLLATVHTMKLLGEDPRGNRTGSRRRRGDDVNGFAAFMCLVDDRCRGRGVDAIMPTIHVVAAAFMPT